MTHSVLTSPNHGPEPRTTAPPPDFNRLAHLYRWMELATFGPWLQLCRCAWLPQMADCRRALVLGDGDGRFTARLLEINPSVRVDAVDASEAMLKALVRRARGNSDRVTTHCVDIRSFTPARSGYDLVVTHFFLDCLTEDEVESLAERVRNSTIKGGLWAISEFAIPPGRFGRWIAQPIVTALYQGFGWLTGLRIRNLPGYASALRRAGFAPHARRSRLGGLLVAELWRSETGIDS